MPVSTRTRTAQYDPENPVGDGKARMGMSPFQDTKLLPES
jgi:hypothetical protein